MQSVLINKFSKIWVYPPRFSSFRLFVFYSAYNPRYCECSTDKYEQPFILMRDFHWSEKGFWYCRSRSSFAQVRSLWFSRHYKHLVNFLFARANSNNSNLSSYFWKVRFYLWSASGFSSRPIAFFVIYQWYTGIIR